MLVACVVGEMRTTASDPQFAWMYLYSNDEMRTHSLRSVSGSC